MSNQNEQATTKTTIKTTATAVDKPLLLKKQLVKQLTYYFSKQNLSTDVYLQTIMKLNSGHVPVTILANFSNVNKIIAKSGILQLQDTNYHDDHDESQQQHSPSVVQVDSDRTNDNGHKGKGESSSSSSSSIPTTTTTAATPDFNLYSMKIQSLLCEAASESNLLSLVKLNQYGKVVTTDNSNINNDIHEGETDDNCNSNTTGNCASKYNQDYRFFDAIGPSSEFNGVVVVEDKEEDELINNNHIIDSKEGGSSNKYTEQQSQPQLLATEPTVATTAATTSATTSATATAARNNNNKNTSIIILREVHNDATEDNIRQIFDDDKIIISIQKEIGNCWFITLDMEHSSKDLVTIMLDLKTKTICNEAIKARVKSQIIATSTSISTPSTTTTVTTNGQYYYNNKSVSDNSYNNNSYSYNRNGKRGMKGGQSSFPYFSSSSSREYSRHKSNQVYSGDRANYYVSKSYPRGSYGGGVGSTNSSFRKQQDQYHHDSNQVLDDINKTKKDLINSRPPPPVIEKHYPSLSGAKIGDSSPTSVTTLDLSKQNSKNVHSSSIAVDGGYAAALLKEVPPQQRPVITASSFKPPMKSKPVTEFPPPPPSSSSASTKGIEKKHENLMRGSFGKMTVTTAITDDASSDEKSSLSSKPESDNFAIGTTVGAGQADTPSKPLIWGGRRSFADVLKK